MLGSVSLPITSWPSASLSIPLAALLRPAAVSVTPSGHLRRVCHARCNQDVRRQSVQTNTQTTHADIQMQEAPSWQLGGEKCLQTNSASVRLRFDRPSPHSHETTQTERAQSSPPR